MSIKKPSWKDIKMSLSELNSTQLIGVLQDLYRFSSENKDFFHSRFLSEQIGDDYIEPYKTRIREAICPREPWNKDISLSAGRKAISEFKKANDNLEDVLNLMLYYVICGNDFTLEFGDIDEPFYNSMESMFGSIIKTLIQQNDEKLTAKFMPKLEAEAKRVEWMGWGYGDALGDWLGDLQEAFPSKHEITA